MAPSASLWSTTSHDSGHLLQNNHVCRKQSCDTQQCITAWCTAVREGPYRRVQMRPSHQQKKSGRCARAEGPAARRRGTIRVAEGCSASSLRARTASCTRDVSEGQRSLDGKNLWGWNLQFASNCTLTTQIQPGVFCRLAVRPCACRTCLMLVSGVCRTTNQPTGWTARCGGSRPAPRILGTWGWRTLGPWSSRSGRSRERSQKVRPVVSLLPMDRGIKHNRCLLNPRQEHSCYLVNIYVVCCQSRIKAIPCSVRGNQSRARSVASPCLKPEAEQSS